MKTLYRYSLSVLFVLGVISLVYAHDEGSPTAFAPPTEIALSPNTVAENEPTGTLVGTFSTTDPEDTDQSVFTYAKVSGAGAADNDQFTITDNQLFTAASFDYEDKNSYSVRIETTDSQGGTFEKAFTITVIDNEAPTNIALDNTSVDENKDPGELVGTFTTTDPEDTDQSVFTYTLVDGSADNDQFAIANDNQLVTVARFDFETKSSYSVLIRTTDSGGETFEKSLTIDVNDVAENQNPTNITLSPNTVAENEPTGTLVGTFSTTDPEDTDQSVFTYAKVSGAGAADNDQFTITDNQLFTAASFDYEDKNSYSVRIETTDLQGGTFEKAFTITVSDVDENQAPTDIGLDNNSVAENEASGTLVGTFTTTDAEDNQPTDFTYAKATGAGDTDNDQFTVAGDQLLTAATFNFEAKPTYTVRIQTTDSDGGTFEKAFTITVTNVVEPPTDITLSASSVAENQAVGTVVGTLTTADGEDTDQSAFSYALVPGTGSDNNSQFDITNDTELATTAIFDAEAKSEYNIRVQTTDSEGGTFEKAFTITITDVAENQAPTDIAMSNNTIAENQPINSEIGTLSTVDADHTTGFTYSLVAGTGDNDNDAFRIVGDKLNSDQQFDFEAQENYQVRIRTEDPEGAMFDKAFTITVTDVDENTAPTDISLDNSSIAENQAVGSLVGKLSTTDSDDTGGFAYTLTAGAGDDDNASFSISGNQLRSEEVFDFETKTSYTVRITTTDDGGKSFAKAFTIAITDIDEVDNFPPSDLVLSNATIPENAPPDTEIGLFTVTDPDADDTHVITLVDGAGDDDNGRFQIRDNALVALVSFDFEKRTSYGIRVQAKDPKDATITKLFTITVTDVEDNTNEAPTDIVLSDTVVEEGQIINLTVGTFSATDPNPGDLHTFSLVDGEGDNDNSTFTISEGKLLTAQTFDFETQSVYRIRVRADDGKGGTFERALVITVIDDGISENSIPEVANPLTDLVAEVGEPFSFALPENTFTDADADAVLAIAFTLENDAPLPVWLVYNNSDQTLSGTPPADAPDSLVVVVTATDDQGASAADQFTLTINRVTALNDQLPHDAWVVYPVPTDQYHITVRSPAVPGSYVFLQLLDVSGRLLRTYQGRTSGGLSEYSLVLPTTLRAGTYFLAIETPKAIVRKRMLLR